MISASALLSVVIWLVIVGLILYVLWWLIGYVGLPEPFNKVARVIIAVVAAIVLINFLLQIGGFTPLIRF